MSPGVINQHASSPAAMPAMPRMSPNLPSPLCGLPPAVPTPFDPPTFNGVQSLSNQSASVFANNLPHDAATTSNKDPTTTSNIDAQLEDNIEAMLNNGPQVSGSIHDSEPFANHFTTHTPTDAAKDKSSIPRRRKNDPGLGNRTADMARSLCKDCNYELPRHFPIGPFDCNLSVLCNTINAYTNTPTCPLGGGFQVGPCRPVKDGGRTVRESFRCKGCKWEVTYELTTEGWLMVRYTPHKDVIRIASGLGEIGTRKIVNANHHSHLI